MTALLKIDDIHVYYGRVHAVKGISIVVNAGELVAVLGSNGAGKSTTLRAILGILRPRSGDITFEGRSITGLRTDEIVRAGIALVPERRLVFPYMNVMENLRLGAFTAKRSSFQTSLGMVYEMFPVLKARTGQLGGTLSGGEQQMLTIARALMARPKLLLLDHPSLGLSPTMVQVIANSVQAIRQMGTTVVLVEQNAPLALSLADRGYVLETGQVAVAGSAGELVDNDHVRRVYLGL